MGLQEIPLFKNIAKILDRGSYSQHLCSAFLNIPLVEVYVENFFRIYERKLVSKLSARASFNLSKIYDDAVIRQYYAVMLRKTLFERLNVIEYPRIKFVFLRLVTNKI